VQSAETRQRCYGDPFAAIRTGRGTSEIETEIKRREVPYSRGRRQQVYLWCRERRKLGGLRGLSEAGPKARP